PVLNVSTIVPPVALHVTSMSAVSPAAVNPTAMKCAVWLALTVSWLGKMATRVTTGAGPGPGPGPAIEAGFSQEAHSAPARTSPRASFSKAKRTDSLYLNVMALPFGRKKAGAAKFDIGLSVETLAARRAWRRIRVSPVTLRHRLSTGLL